MKPFKIDVTYKGRQVVLFINQVKGKDGLYFDVAASPELFAPVMMVLDEASGVYVMQGDKIPNELLVLEGQINEEIADRIIQD